MKFYLAQLHTFLIESEYWQPQNWLLGRSGIGMLFQIETPGPRTTFSVETRTISCLVFVPSYVLNRAKCRLRLTVRIIFPVPVARYPDLTLTFALIRIGQWGPDKMSNLGTWRTPSPERSGASSEAPGSVPGPLIWVSDEAGSGEGRKGRVQVATGPVLGS